MAVRELTSNYGQRTTDNNDGRIPDTHAILKAHSEHDKFKDSSQHCTSNLF